jgi:hypothetical protein
MARVKLLAFGDSIRNSLMRLSPYFPSSAWVMTASRFAARAAASLSWLARVENVAWAVAASSCLCTGGFSPSSTFSVAAGVGVLLETMAETAACM